MKKFKKTKIISLTLMVALVSSTLAVPTNAETAAQTNGGTTTYIISTANDKAYEALQNEIDISSENQTETLEENNILVANLTEEELKTVQNNDDVILVEEDIEINANSTDSSTNDSAEPEWNMQAINVDDVDNQNKSSSKVKVAVLDSGVDIIPGIDITAKINLVPEEQYISPLFDDMSGHGTNIASIIAANGEDGINGINPNIELYSVKVLDGDNKAPLSRIIEGIYKCIESDVDIITMSFGTSSYSTALKKAIEDAYAANILMIAAAGNNNDSVEYPAAFKEVMAVAATGTDSNLTDFSNEGEELDIAAPGEKIRVSGAFGLMGVTHGTSIAVPHVAGVASLLWEKDLSKSNEFIRQLINYSAKEISNTDYCGLVDAEYALEIYDDFAANYTETEIITPSEIPENESETESFIEIDDDTAYVEGRWHTADTSTDLENNGHKYFIENADPSSYEISNKGIQLLKAGTIFSDKGYGWNSGDYGEFHGRFREKINGSTKEVNYIAAYELLTEIAMTGGDTSSFTVSRPDLLDDFEQRIIGSVSANGLKSSDNTWHKWKNIIQDKSNVSGYSDEGAGAQKSYRRHFLLGIAIHTATDAFAHSAFEKLGNDANGNPQWKIIPSGSYKDDATYGATVSGEYSSRFKAAAQVAKKAIKCFANGYDFGYKQFRALTDYDRTFRLANLLRFAKENKKSALTAEEWDGMAKGDIAAKYNMGADDPVIFSHSLARSSAV